LEAVISYSLNKSYWNHQVRRGTDIKKVKNRRYKKRYQWKSSWNN